MFRKLRLFNMFSSLFRANFQNATHLIDVALSAFHRIPNPLQCLGQYCARAGDVDPLEAATAVSEDLAAVEPQLRLVDHQVFSSSTESPVLRKSSHTRYVPSRSIIFTPGSCSSTYCLVNSAFAFT